MCFYSFGSVFTELTWIKCNKGMIAEFQHPINFISAWLHEYKSVCACVGPALLGRTFNPLSFRSSYTATHAWCAGVCRRKHYENHLSLFPEGLWCTKGYLGPIVWNASFSKLSSSFFKLNNSFYELCVKLLVVQVAGLQRWSSGKIITTVTRAI